MMELNDYETVETYSVEDSRAVKAVVIDHWSTPLTTYVRGSGASQLSLPSTPLARLRIQKYEPGVYRMENVGGIEYWMTSKSLPVVTLERRDPEARGWKEWMVDDPLHWYGMRERVMALPSGHVWIAGLGLGLMLQHLAERPDVTATVVEIDPQVIELIVPTLPVTGRVAIVNDNWYTFLERQAKSGAAAPAALFWDLAVGGVADTSDDLLYGKVTAKVWFPDVPLFRFGTKRVGGE